MDVPKQSSTAQPNLLTVLSRTGNKCPLFLLPPGSGSVLPWISLAQYLHDRPVYAFRLRGLEIGELPFQNMSEILDTYEKVIRSTQPHGPYAFLGMSLGSGIAFELAKRFEQSGEAPAFLGILDSPPSGSVMEAAGPSELLVIDILRLRGVLTEKDVDGLKDNHERHGRESTIEKLILLHREALEKSGFTEDSLLAWIRTMDSGVGISQGGEATGKVKNLDLFEAEPVVGWGFTKQQWSAEIRRWDQFASDFQHHEVPGNHLTLIRHPHVQTFREALAKAFLHRGI